MKPARIVAAAILLASVRLSTALAQSTDLEPGVQTSDSSRPAAPQPPATPPTPPTPPTPQASQAPARSPAAAAPASPQNPPPGSGATKGGGKTQDRIELGTTQISGNRELPKVMYVVPWRKADLGEFAGRPPNSLLDEALTPVDRSVFQRQNRYFAALQAGSDASKAPPDSGTGGAAAPQVKDEK
jgi:hypothetical protein